MLVVRVHPENLVAQKLPAEARGHHVWKHRYHAINEWERYLSDNGFRIVKLFLNLSKEEQRTRFLRRIDLPEHNWKFSSHDLQERRYWDAYQDAFSEMFTHTSTEWAPWYVIPADRKWFARVAAAAVIAQRADRASIRSTRPSARTRSATSSGPSASSRPRRPTVRLRIRSRRQPVPAGAGA